MNVYMYVRSMPLRAIDPTGLLAELLQVGATGDNGDGDGDGDGDEGGGDDDCDDKEKCPGGKLKTTQKVVIKGQVVAQNECELCCPAGSPPRASVEIGRVKGGGSVPRGASIVEVDGDVYWYKIICECGSVHALGAVAMLLVTFVTALVRRRLNCAARTSTPC